MTVVPGQPHYPPSSRALPLAVLDAGAGAAPRPLRSPIVPLLCGPADVTLSMLLTDCVRRRFVLHPALSRWLDDAGWSARGAARVLTPRPRRLDDPRLEPLRQVLGDQATSALCQGGVPQQLRYRFGDAEVTLRLSSGRLTVRADELTMPPADASAWVAALPPIVLAGDASWFRIDALGRTALVVEQSADNPARAVCRLPADRATLDGSAVEALSRIEDLHLYTPVALDPRVLDVAGMTTAAMMDRDGLFPAQDQLVSSLLATEIGAVLAAAPGSGKTVIVSAAIAETHERTIVVTAPPAVLAQWVDELQRWAPDRPVRLVRSVADFRRRRADSGVLVVSHQVFAAWARTARSRVELLVVDEAAVLLRRTATSNGLWCGRALTARAWALTGSPHEIGTKGSIAQLVAWSRGLPRQSVGDHRAEAFDPIVTGLGIDVGLPEVVLETLPVTPTADDHAWLTNLVESTPLNPTGLARVNAARRLRLGLGDPLAVGQLYASSKRNALLARVLEHAAAGGTTLVFTSSVTLAELFVEQVREFSTTAAVLPSSSSRGERVRTLSAFYTGTLSVLAVTASSQRGVNLQRANLVVHLDLPATRAEFEQRNGRAARIGNPHPEVRVLWAHLEGTLDERWARTFIDATVHDVDVLSLA